MPIIRYFVFVGGLLLALLFAADQYLPAPAEHGGGGEPDKTIIRIGSARSLPEKIVFDTNPRTDLPMMTQANLGSEAPEQQVHEGMAVLPEAPPGATKKESPVRAEARARPKWSVKFSKRAPEPRLAFERHAPFAGGWW